VLGASAMAYTAPAFRGENASATLEENDQLAFPEDGGP